MKTLTLTLFAATAAVSHASLFELTITNNGPQPLSPLTWSAGNSNYDIFKFGTPASLGIKRIAEGGNGTILDGNAAASSDVVAHGILGSSPLAPGNSRTVTFNTDSSHGIFSFAAMLGKTNDGFIGESASSMGLNLFSGSTPLGFSVNIYGTRAWDAGTELNTQNAADLGFLGGSGNPADTNSFIRVHGGIVPGVGDSWAQQPAWTDQTNLATVTIRPVPEPATYAALGLGVTAVLRRRRKS